MGWAVNELEIESLERDWLFYQQFEGSKFYWHSKRFLEKKPMIDRYISMLDGTETTKYKWHISIWQYLDDLRVTMINQQKGLDIDFEMNDVLKIWTRDAGFQLPDHLNACKGQICKDWL